MQSLFIETGTQDTFLIICTIFVTLTKIKRATD